MGQTSTRENGDLSAGTHASGIKVLDRSVLILTTVADGACTLTELCERTDLPRATAHRLATALEVHRLVARTPDGRWTTGPGLAALTPVTSDLLADAAAHVLPRLMELTGESVQIYRLTGDTRTCIASLEPPTGLRNTVPVGSRMPLTAGSAGRVFLAFGPHGLAERFLAESEYTEADLAQTRRDGWAESIGERDPALASVSAPVRNSVGEMEAVLSISGPVERLSPSPYGMWGEEILKSAHAMGTRL
ncbi:IclR family transcriptional regulator [Corynebacterium sp. TAE3-ERU12]|uniref:IclR family transcriptional regulator n=1 Tax=Corynebacterium sp. TAE3-ERU12 TaxID=2849491 RepID=UPI001C484941|nr:IclR family transcriptional regulator [Corynebacterium sp. TAE3-ERU12]MBV7295180.1 IclR family transcriptional regulator [Corynebacterium sp. TAE3-ERU12]